jgi:hypothetical protein
MLLANDHGGPASKQTDGGAAAAFFFSRIGRDSARGTTHVVRGKATEVAVLTYDVRADEDMEQSH